MSASCLQPILDILEQNIIDLSDYTRTTNYTFASLTSTTTQLQPSASTPTTISFDTIEISSNFVFDLSNYPTRVPITTTGIYKFSYSIQLDKAGGGVSVCDIWIRIDGNDLSNSCSQMVVNGTNGETLPFVEYVLQLNAGQYIEVCFASTDSTMGVTYFPAQSSPYVRPSIPSIIFNIYKLA